MVKSILTKISILLGLILFLYGCNQMPSNNETYTESMVITEPTEATTLTQQEEITHDYPVPVVPDEYYNRLWPISKHSFTLLFGEECIRETPKNSYAVVQRESGARYFVFFDENEVSDGPWPVDMGVFHSNEEFLDYILGNSPTMNEMSAYDNFFTGIGDVEAYYTQEGVFLLIFPYKRIYIDGELQSTERCLQFIAYYDYEDLCTEEDLYSDRIWYILPEDRRTGDASPF